MCKRHAICDGQENCIYVIDGIDCSAEAMIARFEQEVSIPFQLSNLGELALAVTEASPTIPVIEASRIAAYLDSIGYCKAPF